MAHIINVPPTRCGVYHIIRDDKVIYVGQTTNIFSRLASWQTGKFKHEHFDRVEFFPCDLEDLNAVEEEHIRRIRPLLNVEGVTEPFRPPKRVSDAPRWWYERRASAQVRARRDSTEAA